MTTMTDLRAKHCTACENGTPPLPPARVGELLAALPDWTLSADARRIRREWVVKDFAAGLDFFARIGKLADAEDHHPDLHLVDYRKAAVELSTHAARGLTENDFILAAKIDALPVELKK